MLSKDDGSQAKNMEDEVHSLQVYKHVENMDAIGKVKLAQIVLCSMQTF